MGNTFCGCLVCPYNIRDSTFRKVPLEKNRFWSKEVVVIENV